MPSQRKEKSPRKGNSPLGKSGEDFAVRFLLQQGYKIIDRNFRSRFGEIDVVSLKDNCLIFIEVKTRFSKRFGNPFEAVTPRKIRKITKTAEYYSLIHPELPKKLLIQIVGLEVENGKAVFSKVVTVC